jgi:TolA-binding protein
VKGREDLSAIESKRDAPPIPYETDALDRRLVVTGVISSVARRTSQPADDLQKQLAQLKQKYESTTHDADQRIASLEPQIQKRQEKEKRSSRKKPKRPPPSGLDRISSRDVLAVGACVIVTQSVFEDSGVDSGNASLLRDGQTRPRPNAYAK